MNPLETPIAADLLVGEGRAYLLAFNGVTPEVLDIHLQGWKRDKCATKAELFRSMVMHAQNRQGMPNSIGDIGNLRAVFCDFNPDRVLKTYRTWRELFDAVANGVKVPGRLEPEIAKSHWVVYAKSVLSCASFLRSFDSTTAFHAFVDSFNFNEHSKLALPLLLKEEIYGFGFALACDFLKENGYKQFLKPDTHINDICRALGISKATTDFGVFKDAVAYCDSNSLVPYEFDKLLWLIGSGRFYRSKIAAPVDKELFIQRMQALSQVAPA
jgi:hypothetical protein